MSPYTVEESCTIFLERQKPLHSVVHTCTASGRPTKDPNSISCNVVDWTLNALPLFQDSYRATRCDWFPSHHFLLLCHARSTNNVSIAAGEPTTFIVLICIPASDENIASASPGDKGLPGNSLWRAYITLNSSNFTSLSLLQWKFCMPSTELLKLRRRHSSTAPVLTCSLCHTPHFLEIHYIVSLWPHAGNTSWHPTHMAEIILELGFERGIRFNTSTESSDRAA